MAFKKIIQSVENDLNLFDSVYKSRLKTKVSLLSTIINYGTKSKGKKLRPALVFLSGLACGGKVDERAMNGAILTEMLHNATLVHDDVVDDADERRGLKSINALWSNQIAVLVGDYYLAQGLLTAIDNNEFEYLRILSNTVKRMSEGELNAIEHAKSLTIDESTYLSIASDKTASLLSTCTEVGAVSASSTEEQRQCLAGYGEKIGVAFQLKDDIFDYVSSHSIIGKPTGNDLREKKITLPLIYALDNAEKKKKSEVLKILKQKELSKKDIEYIIEFAKKSGGIEYTKKKAEQYSEEAKSCINKFPDSEAKTALLLLADFVHQREK